MELTYGLEGGVRSLKRWSARRLVVCVNSFLKSHIATCETCLDLNNDGCEILQGAVHDKYCQLLPYVIREKVLEFLLVWISDKNGPLLYAMIQALGGSGLKKLRIVNGVHSLPHPTAGHCCCRKILKFLSTHGEQLKVLVLLDPPGIRNQRCQALEESTSEIGSKCVNLSELVMSRLFPLSRQGIWNLVRDEHGNPTPLCCTLEKALLLGLDSKLTLQLTLQLPNLYRVLLPVQQLLAGVPDGQVMAWRSLKDGDTQLQTLKQLERCCPKVEKLELNFPGPEVLMSLSTFKYLREIEISLFSCEEFHDLIVKCGEQIHRISVSRWYGNLVLNSVGRCCPRLKTLTLSRHFVLRNSNSATSIKLLTWPKRRHRKGHQLLYAWKGSTSHHHQYRGISLVNIEMEQLHHMSTFKRKPIFKRNIIHSWQEANNTTKSEWYQHNQ